MALGLLQGHRAAATTLEEWARPLGEMASLRVGSPTDPPKPPSPMHLSCYSTVALSASQPLSIQCSPLCGRQSQVTPSGKPRAKGHLPVVAAGTYLERDTVCSQCHVLRKMLQPCHTRWAAGPVSLLLPSMGTDGRMSCDPLCTHMAVLTVGSRALLPISTAVRA